MEKKLNQLGIIEAAEGLRSGRFSSVELVQVCLERIDEADKDIHACLLVDREGALEAARQADQRLKEGNASVLTGIPYLAKDVIMTKGLKTTAASRILENYIAPYDATAISRLKEAGAVLLGKTNLDEFAHGASTENSAYGPTRNPHDLSRVAGGSSGGSAAAVAADMCLFALGTDTGGSIRQPASFCGVFGLKPSYGLISRFGLISMTSSTDCLGVFAKSAADASLLADYLKGPDGHDATCLEQVDGFASQGEGVAGLKVGLPKEYFLDSLDPAIKEIVMAKARQLEVQGAEIKEVSLPYTKYGISVYYIITPAEISSNLAKFDGIGWGLSWEEATDLQSLYESSRGEGFGPEAKRRIMLGTYVLSAGYADAYYKRAQAVRIKIVEDFKKAFTEVDVLLTPTTPHPAFPLGEKSNDPLAMYLEDIFVTGASLAGLPAISVPAGLMGELPIGAQIIGPKGKDSLVLRVARAMDKG